MGMGLIFALFHRPRFMAAYFNQPDNAAHKSGPYSDAVSGSSYMCQNKASSKSIIIFGSDVYR